MMRPLALRKTSSKAGSITRSDGVQPGRSALVEFGQQGQHAALGQLGQLGIVGRPTVYRGVVELVVAGVDHQTGGGGDTQSHPIGDGVADVEELHLEGADVCHLARLHGVQLDLVQQSAARQLELHQPARQARGIDRGIDLLQQVVDGAGVVFVPVGDHHAAHPAGLVV